MIRLIVCILFKITLKVTFCTDWLQTSIIPYTYTCVVVWRGIRRINLAQVGGVTAADVFSTY